MPWSQDEPIMLLGRLLERSEAILDRMTGLERRQEGLERQVEHQLVTVRDRIDKVESVQQALIPGWEKAVKALLPIVIMGGALAWTGSFGKAVHLLTEIGQLLAAARAISP